MNNLTRKISLKHIIQALKRRLHILLGLDFMSSINTDALGLDPEQSYGYEPISRNFFVKVLKYLKVNNQDSIIDIGCGKGYAVHVMMKFPFKKVDGLEISEPLVKIARNNFKNRKSNKPSIYLVDAVDFKYYDNYNYYLFNNPFSSKVMLNVIEKINESIKRKPRKITIIYATPTCHKEIISSKVFSKTAGFRYKTKDPIWIYNNDLT